jgi:hypothetical protein
VSAPILRYFAYDHLTSQGLRAISEQLARLALAMDAALADGPEKSAGLRKLLEAKDCCVRAALDTPPDDAPRGVTLGGSLLTG